MSLSPQSIEILLDLIEIKMGYMHVQDRDDAKELLKLRYCRQELLKMLDGVKHTPRKKGSSEGQMKFPRQVIRALRKQNHSQ
ncbi:MAG: hypothetical protein J0G29_05495 [Alphaproteobacteria bacterium]|nr:hypothetical protein [Alphaproteobacteria bacterium]OJV47090.1 MAG: hypothetical protein BGO28_01425 [Alphaproteobacteria bacterium 43-37]